MYLLDTNVVSELRKARSHPRVREWLNGVASADLYLSAVTIGELQAGVEVTREQDAAKAAEIEVWIDSVVEAFDVLPLDERVFRLWARLMHRQTINLVGDAMIAATAEAHNLRVVTRNTRDFKRLGVESLNPWS